MPESATASGPSLEQILWRAMDRFTEEPALLDAEEFAAHLEHVFEGHLAVEDFADHFFAGADRLHEPRAGNGEVRARRPRLHAYQFDLRELEYVVVEDEDRVVVVSDFGQFAVEGSDALTRTLQSAVVKAPERARAEPKAYFVRKTGEVVGLDVNKVSRTLDQLFVRQVSLPAVDAPAQRLSMFEPVRTTLSPAREIRAVREQPRLRRPPPPAAADRAPARAPSAAPPPAGARSARFVL